jgi:serine/threonine protein kinase
MTMTPELWRQARALFHACLDLSPAERLAYLETECHDAVLRAEVESLLHLAAGTETFLEAPALAVSDPLAAPPAWLGMRLGAYAVTELLSTGGMGEVYRAIRADDQYHQQVAIKRVRQGYEGEQTLARFRAERQILASLDHPNIARLLDAGIAPSGEPYFVMQLIDGEPIDRYCESRALPLDARLRLFCQVCEAVSYAHRHLTIHRDIKPANILVTADGNPKLLDFGIAKVLGEGLEEATRGTLLAMTPDYASPEQVRGEPVTTVSDVYSLGVVLYRLLTGKSPYRATHTEPYTLAREVVESEPVKPSQALKDTPTGLRLPSDVDAIVLMAMRKEPERRYASAHDLAADIEKHLAGRPVSAAPDSYRYKASKFVRRHRVGVAAAAVALIAALAGISTIVVEARIASAQRDRAERRFDEMRGLTNTLIFDLEESIGRLQGSTAARKLVVEQALRYLDALTKDAREDRSLQRDLGAAYQKLGDIQGNPVRANLGLIAEARVSYDKAIAIREALVSSDPESVEDELNLASSYEWLADFLHSTNGDLKTSLVFAQKALAIYERLYGHNEDPKVARRLIGVYETFASIQGGSGSDTNLGDVDAAVGSIRKALAVCATQLARRPDDEIMQRVDAMLRVYLGEYMIKQGNRADAIAQYQGSLKTFEALNSKTPSADNVRNLSLISSRIGNALSMDGEFAAALKRYKQSRSYDELALGADPDNVLARFDLAATLALLGNATARTGDTREGLGLLRQAIDLLEAVRSKDDSNEFVRRLLSLFYMLRGQIELGQAHAEPALKDFVDATQLISGNQDPQSRISSAALTVKRGHALARLHDARGATEAYNTALVKLASFIETPRPQLEALYAAADAHWGLATVLGEASSGRCGPSGHLDRGLDLYRRIPHPGVMDPSGFEAPGPLALSQELAGCGA